MGKSLKRITNTKTGRMGGSRVKDLIREAAEKVKGAPEVSTNDDGDTQTVINGRTDNPTGLGGLLTPEEEERRRGKGSVSSNLGL